MIDNVTEDSLNYVKGHILGRLLAIDLELKKPLSENKFNVLIARDTELTTIFNLLGFEWPMQSGIPYPDIER